MPLAEALANGGGVAEPALLARLGLDSATRVRIGDTDVEIRSVLMREPDRIGGLFSLGPRLLVGRSTLDAAQVLLPGALARYEYKVTLPEGIDAEAFAVGLQRGWPDAGWRARSPRDVPAADHPRHRSSGDLPDAGGADRPAQRRPGDRARPSRRIWRGAPAPSPRSRAWVPAGGQVFTIYLAQVMLLAVAGVVLGIALGLLLPLAVRLVPDGVLPIAPDLGVYAGPLARAALAGLLTTFVFAVWPLAIAREVSPARLFRALVTPTRRWPRPPYLVRHGDCRGGTGRGRDPGRPAAQHRRLVRADGGGGRPAAVGPHPPAPARRQPAAASRRLRAAACDRQPASARARPRRASSWPWVQASRCWRRWRCWPPTSTTRWPCACRARAPALYLIDVQPEQRDVLGQALADVPGSRLEQLLPSLRARVVRIAGPPRRRGPGGGQCRLDGQP